MSKRDPEVALKQLLSHAREAVNSCEGKTRDDLDTDRLLNLVFTRLIEIIGEAANRVPAEVQDQYPGLPWIQRKSRLMVGATAPCFLPPACHPPRKPTGPGLSSHKPGR